ncbi:27-O-demethylrifamycin SV methyltransferase [bacterium HR07]|uniref:Methyltransferase type 11 n=1 Tax=Acetithermum autotrophicum TaxID=1446466 RepID=H5SUZ6_ACEAU|nr:methyltransferase type 11 [Candidatus Acetothermum autotrophicum]GBC75968.1 27-O-demethylrifamycin SV methyltransferase [bacterium HR07]
MEMQRFEKWVVNGPLWSGLLRVYYLPRLFRLVDTPLVGASGLELGCGQGITTEEILKRFPRLHLTALDYDPDQVARAQERVTHFSDRISIHQGDATALSFPDDHWDVIFACNLFHHMREYRRALAEAARVLKPTGRLYVMDFDRRFFNPILRKLFPPEVLFTREEFIQDVHKAGLHVERSVGGPWVFFVRASKQ